MGPHKIQYTEQYEKCSMNSDVLYIRLIVQSPLAKNKFVLKQFFIELL